MVVFNFNRMRLTLLVASLCVLHISAKVTKKSHKELTTTKIPKKSHQPAIIAIEIVDPKQNNTKEGKSRKRTIDGSLGYGYQNFFNVQQKPPKYEVYKYSQHDIPPIKVNNIGHQNLGGHQHLEGLVGHKNIEIQKSVRYDLGSTKPEFIPNKQYYQPNLNQYYQHGTTLFSTLDQNGHAGGLTSQTPHGGAPVIYLRVYTNQLGQPGGLHANIPQNHPYSQINQIDLQSLLSKYVQNHYQQQNYQQPEQQYYYPQQDQGYHQQDYDLQTHENYPDDQHTKVIFHKDKGKKSKPTVVYKTHSAQKFKITVPDDTYSKVEIEEHTVAPTAQQHYQQQQQEQEDYYYPEQQYYQQQQQAQPNVQTHIQQHVQTHIQPHVQTHVQPHVQTYVQPHVQTQVQSHSQNVQPQVQYQYQQPQIQVQPQTYQQQYQYYQYPDANQYGYPQDYDYQDQYQDYDQQQQQQHQQHQQQQHAAHPQQEHGDESNDPVLHNTSVQAGKDLHTKLYNYHAHGPVGEEKSTSRSVNKKRKVRVTDVGNAGLNKEKT